jgi:uncharacterized membrane protein YhaH (DUF805 family)
MNTFDLLFDIRTSMHRFAYFVNVVAMVGFSIGLGCFVYELFSSNHLLFTLTIFLQIIIGVFTVCGVLLLTIRRLQDAGMPGLWSLSMFIPGLNILMFMYLCIYRGRTD